MLGKTEASWLTGTPNHWARVLAYWTMPVLGTQRPLEPESSGPPRVRVGKVPYILPPLTAPPRTMWWEPQAWSEPVLELGWKVRAKSDMVKVVISLAMPISWVAW